MKIGVPKEIKNCEHRVGLLPDGVQQLCAHGHEVFVQSHAGIGCGVGDDAYRQAGAIVVETSAEAWDADLIIKVKEPLPEEYGFLRRDMVLFTFLHLAAVPELAQELARRGVLAIGYETVQLQDGSLPLLAPMSRIAGRVAIQRAAHYLQRENGTNYPGNGRLFGGIEDAPVARVLIIGGGNAGTHAAIAASGLGANVHVLEARQSRAAELRKISRGGFAVSLFAEGEWRKLLDGVDVLIGAALLPGEHAPVLLARDELAMMHQGGVFVDIAIDQGGMSESSRVTSYAQPVYVEAGIIHCCLPNLPASVPVTSTYSLTAATLPYVMQLANQGADQAIVNDPALARGVNVLGGKIIHPGVAKSLGI